jgi:hypothetical protein
VKYLRIILLTGLLALIPLLGSDIWYDDACHFLVLKGLIATGVEAFPINAHEYNPHSLFITVGPVVNYPAALILQLTGVQMWAARLFIWLHSLGVLFLLTKIVSQFSRNKTAGLWAVILLGLNIQFLVYGTQYLGEVPAILGLLIGIYFQHRWLNKRQIIDFFGVIIGWQFAVLSKEYIAVPIGMSLLTFFIAEIINRISSPAVQRRGYPAIDRYRSYRIIGLGIQGILLPTGILIYYWLRFDSRAAFENYFHHRLSYGSEFWVWELEWSVWFLISKPVVILGTLAVAIRVWTKRLTTDIFSLHVQCWLLFFFLASAGYDRFGLLLLPIAAMYLSEWVAAGFRKLFSPWKRLPVWAIISILLLGFLLISGRTSWQLIHYVHQIYTNGANTDEKNIIHQRSNPTQPVMLYDLPLVLFLPDSVEFQLPQWPPCAAQFEPPTSLPVIAGIFAHDYYPHTFAHQCKDSTIQNNRYQLYRSCN